MGENSREIAYKRTQVSSTIGELKGDRAGGGTQMRSTERELKLY
jgi:hypothetical protein